MTPARSGGADAVADTSTDRQGGQTWPGLLGRLLAGTDLGAEFVPPSPVGPETYPE